MMHRLLLALTSALALHAAVAQAAPPARLDLAWDLSKDGSTIAVIAQKLEQGAGKYEITETWEGRGLFRLFGSARRASRGDVVGGVLRPLEYSDERSGREPERARFDWKAKTVTYQYKGPPTTIALPAHATDDLAGLFGFLFTAPGESPVLM